MSGRAEKRTKVVFIGGYGRSGSTLLGLLLDQHPSFVFAGELVAVWAHFEANRPCGCETPLRECPFWSTVMNDIAERLPSFDVQRMVRLQRRVDPGWRLPNLRSVLSGNAYEGAHYREAFGQLCRSIEAVSGCSVVVDSSKVASHGFILNSISTVRTYPIHLIRDSRATAFSLRRSRFSPSHGKDLERRNLLRAALAWSVANVEVGRLRRANPDYRMLLYDDLVNQPGRVVAAITDLVAEPPPDSSVLEATTIRPSHGHSISGNPLKFAQAEIAIRPDEEWRHGLSGVEKGLVRTLTWPAQAWTRRLQRGKRALLPSGPPTTVAHRGADDA
ncbi:MAG TPA: hypothetical protein VHI97_06050 [Actinomycetota bacterium]|nr:hypothetical protein [Actinomycetota bacterium]